MADSHKFRDFSPQASNAVGAAISRRILVRKFADTGVSLGQRDGSPGPLLSVFYTEASIFSLK
jgi:hypothetical protein